MPKLVLIRHGQSVWNRENIFTGWVDVPLSLDGIDEAISAGKEIADIEFDVIYTSKLSRAHETTQLVMAQNNKPCCPLIIHEEERYQIPDDLENYIPIYQSEALNERHYGDLQGKNKDQVRAQVGDEQFMAWRRSYEGQPPNGESLKKTVERTMPYFDEVIVPELVKGKTVLVSAHGNSLRGILKELDQISDEDIVKLEIATGMPIICEFDEGMWNKISG